MKRIYSTLCTIIFLFSFLTACADKNNSSIEYFGDTVSKNTLRVCIDAEHLGNNLNEYARMTMYDDLAQDIKNTVGIERVSIEVLPSEGAERETVLQRLRTEIMAGGGPDVFIQHTVVNNFESDYVSVLFNFPEKNMESGLFLPLDEYMENNTQFTDWSKQTKAVMDAGRSDEGQVIIPLAYTFPVLVYPQNKVNIPYTSELTMQEILDNPETLELGASLYANQGGNNIKSGGRPVHTSHLVHMLGKLADYKSEELLFTEEELYEFLDTMCSLNEVSEGNQLQYLEGDVSSRLFYQIALAYFDTDMTLVPLYSRNGGVTASITSYAAVNRNTNFPEKAFSVIDYLMQEEMQRESKLYHDLLATGSLPMQNDLGQEEKPIANGEFLGEQYFEDLLAIKNRITAVNFHSEFDIFWERLVFDSAYGGSVSKEAVSETYEKMKRMMGE